jgi:hypothetical protein
VTTETTNSPPELIPSATDVPFRAHEENSIVIVPPFLCVPPDFPDNCSPLNTILHAEFPGVIRGTHVGSGTIFSTSQVDFSVFPFAQTTQAVITAANGDELHWDGVGIGFLVEGFPDSTVFNGNFTFVGGTGRFENATGGGTYAGSANTAAAQGQFDMEGSISMMAGSKSPIQEANWSAR